MSDCNCIANYEGKCAATKCGGEIVSFHQPTSKKGAKMMYDISRNVFDNEFGAETEDDAE